MRIGIISDHLAVTTGFKVITEPFAREFVRRGWDVHYLGILGERMTWDEDDPIKMTAVKNSGTFVEDGVLQEWLIRIKPDIVFAERDAGTMGQMCIGKKSISSVWSMIKDGHLEQPMFKVIFYVPIEGIPLSRAFLIPLEIPYYTGGRLVFYTPTAKEIVQLQFPSLSSACEYVYIGLDHFPENSYSDEERGLLKEMAGMSDRMVVTTVGTNKRTKGLAEVIYTASAYKQTWGSDSVMFYIHTEAEDPIIGGHDLHHLAHQYDVQDIVAFKPGRNAEDRKNVLKGIPTHSGNGLLESLRNLRDRGFSPVTAEEAMSNLAHYSMTDIFAMSDMYLDLSSLEGWGLPMGEAMRWGLPVMGVSDMSARDEIYGNSRIIIEPEDIELWDTWNSGARLVKVRPSKVASMIRSLVLDPSPLGIVTREGKKLAEHYKWSASVAKMCDIIEECYGTS